MFRGGILMIKSPDEALERFEELHKTEWSNLSEADTRSKIIDPIFLECLNWDGEDITREENVNSIGYVDYYFKKGGRVLFILEAKKEGISFEIPPNWKNRHYKISGTLSECKELIKAIEQTQKYCNEKGIKIAIVTNGYQYIIFDAIKIGSSWRDGKAIVFNGFDDIQEYFGVFFKYLNKNSVANGALDRLLSDKTELLKFSRPLDKVFNNEAIEPRNYLYQYIAPFVKFIFENITDTSQIDILKHCYAHEKAIYQPADYGIKQLFIDKMPHFTQEDNIKFFEEQEKYAGWFEEWFNYIRRSTSKGDLILLIGGIGSGKTTFIHRFFNIILKDEIKNIWLYVDFKTAPTSIDKLEDYIFEKLVQNFEDRYLQDVESEFKKYGVSLDKSNHEKYLENLFAILKLMNYSVSIVLDNVDRCVIELQEKIYLSAEYMVDKFSILILLALREESYYRSKMSGVFDAYHLTKFFIHSPHFEKLILNRIDYMISLLNKSDEDISKFMGKQINFDGKKEEVNIFFNIIRTSLASNRTYVMKPITLFITQISEGDMRTALDMFNKFLSSGNTKVSEMMEKVSLGEGYIIAPYQFLKSVILSEAKYYRGDKNQIMNLFDLNTELTNSHFLHLRILEYAFLNRTNETRVERGFLEINKLIQEAEDPFIPRAAIEDSLLKLNNFYLIKFNTYAKVDLKNVTHFKITGTGSYYLTQLIKKFTYIDLVHPDTQICDKNTSDSLARTVDTDLLDEKFRRSERFLEYLNQMEEKEFIENPHYKNSRLTNRTFMKFIINDFKVEKDIILNKPKNKFMLERTIQNSAKQNITNNNNQDIKNLGELQRTI